jgi:hypothetical protein
MALQLSAFRKPSLSEREVEITRGEFKKLDAGFEDYNGTIDLQGLQGTDRRLDCPHFWFYPALAVPGVLLSRAMHVHPNFGFVLLNLALLLTALWVVSGRLDWPATLLLFAGPILWWIDKAHTEVFTFALLAIGLALVNQPWWSMLAFAAASTQNLPIAVGVPLVGLAALAMRPDLWRDDRLWLGIAASVALAALHPLYYLARLGVADPQTLVGGTHFHLPRLIELRAFVSDPNLGILPNFPALGPVLLGALAMLAVTRSRALLQPPVMLTLLLAVTFLLCFAQTSNFNSGATPGPARYGLWLIPLAIPLLDEAGRAGPRWWRAALAPVAVVSCVWMVFAYRPGLPESYLQPTRLAAFLWNRYPSLDNPLPEVFFERLTGRETFSFSAPVSPAATASCSKVLLVAGHGPPTCAVPAPVPAECRERDGYCYANRRASGEYGFSVLR